MAVRESGWSSTVVGISAAVSLIVAIVGGLWTTFSYYNAMSESVKNLQDSTAGLRQSIADLHRAQDRREAQVTDLEQRVLALEHQAKPKTGRNPK